MTRIVLVGRVDKLFRRECGTTLLALVTIGSLGTTTRTCANDITVGKELASNLVAELFLCFLYKLVLVVESAEEVGCKLVMNLRGCATVNVE